MAYQVPPSFADGDILSAANLNIISQNLEFFWGLVSGVNVPFTGEKMTGSGASRPWTGRRVGRYLHYKCTLENGVSDELDIRIDGNHEAGDGTNRSAPYTWSGYIDLSATTSAPAIGAFYEVIVEFDFTSGNDFRVVYLIESDSTTL